MPILPLASIRLLLSLLAALVVATYASGGRALQQGTQAIGCRKAIPGCATDVCSLTQHGTQRWVCPKCMPKLYKRSSDGTRCDCAPGSFSDCSSGTCLCKSCPAGSWCRGGRNQATNGAAAVACVPGTTTKAGIIASSQSECLVIPGYGWPNPAASQPTKCPIGTYSVGFRTARTPCTTCPVGMTTLQDTSTSKFACLATPGLYIDGGVAKPCPRGTYQPSYSSQGIQACLACQTGVTTLGIQSTAVTDCAVALPGFGITTCDATLGCQATLCAVGFYNTGGAGLRSCTICPWGFTTKTTGSASDTACMVPPGFGALLPLPGDTTVNSVVPCTFGYNSGWNRAACKPCGINVSSLNNRTSINDCYVLQGQGLQLPDASGMRQAVDCWPGSIGMAVNTPALLARPCDTCPRFMTTLQPLSSDISACRALPGYTVAEGAEEVLAEPCPVGTYKSDTGNSGCTACPGNTSTPLSGATSMDNCTVCLPGYGNWVQSGTSYNVPGCRVVCDPGTYNNGSFALCQQCAYGFTSTAGASNCTRIPPVDCVGSWSSWTACWSASGCGTGTTSSTFVITQPALWGGTECLVTNGTVQTAACSLTPCPVNCQAYYTDWSTCSQTCGGGTQSRSYVITVDGAYGGQLCAFLNNTVEVRSCNTDPCPINCQGDWSTWSVCNATCGNSWQSSVYAVYEPAQFGGTACPVAAGTVRWQQCTVPPCPVDCVAYNTSWSTCLTANGTAAACGDATRTRSFIITVNGANGGLPCVAPNNTVYSESCSLPVCTVDCYGAFTNSSCSATCDGGTLTSTYSILKPATGIGLPCPYANGFSMIMACNTQPCPVNCVGAWSTFSTCNATCAGGWQSSTYIVSRPAQYEGLACPYAAGTVQTQQCNTQPCPINCVGSWSAWSTCSAACAGGSQSAVYTITTQAAYGGTACEATNGQVRTQACNTQPCPIWPVSTCTNKPPSSMNITGLWCPTASNGGGSWTNLTGGNSWSLPPGCRPSNGGCNSAGGQFLENKAPENQLLTTTIEGFERCYCPYAQTKGHVIKQLPGGKIGCVPGAVFIPDNPLKPNGTGVWVDDVINQNAAPSCNGSQACWDMCFWCDGSPRYFSLTTAAQAPGSRRYRNIMGTNCTSSECWMTPTTPSLTETTTFWQACDAFGAGSMPRNNTLLSLINNQWPYRPGQTNYVNLFLLQQALPAGYLVNRGQQVMDAWLPS